MPEAQTVADAGASTAAGGGPGWLHIQAAKSRIRRLKRPSSRGGGSVAWTADSFSEAAVHHFLYSFGLFYDVYFIASPVICSLSRSCFPTTVTVRPLQRFHRLSSAAAVRQVSPSPLPRTHQNISGSYRGTGICRRIKGRQKDGESFRDNWVRFPAVGLVTCWTGF